MTEQGRSGQPQFLFLARHFNDIDHMVPVIWGLLRRGTAPEQIRYMVLYPDPSIEPGIDPRLAFLAGQGIRLETPHLRGALRQAVFSLSTKAPSRLVRRKARKLLHRKLVTSDNNMDYVLEAVRRAPRGSLLVSDHCNSPEIRTLRKAIHERGGSNVALPHGFQLHTGFTDPEFDALTSGNSDPVPEPTFDHILVCTPQQCDSQRLRHPEATVRAMGSARFDPLWLEQLSSLYPAAQQKDSKKLRVLMILEKGGIDMAGQHWEFLDIDEQFRALRHLAEHPGIILRIKGNARGLSHRQGKLLRPYRSLTVEDAIHTHALISGADLVVGCCSSVLMDAYARSKPVLLLEYATRLKMVFKPFGFHDNPHSFQEFTARLDTAVEHGNETLYDGGRLQTLIDYYVYANEPPHDVVDSYARYLQELTETS